MDSIEPTSIGEMQLYKVLQRANLLGYYEIFISQGGDDVQQLCEAGEEEFLEIMSLVGMASKPLHVRRLQKALQEWITSPQLFQNRPPSSVKFSNATTTFAKSSTHKTKAVNIAPRPHSEPNIQNKARSGFDRYPRIFPKSSANDDSPSAKPQQEVANKVDEKTSLMLAQAAMELVEARFPHRLSFEKAIEHIKTSKKRPHLIRILEMENMQTRELELRRQSALFPLHFADRFNASLSLFELMCNDASAHLCQLHPVLLIAERSERLAIAQEVVKTVEKQLKHSQRDLLDLSIASHLPGKADEIISKLSEIKRKQEMLKRKMLEAKEVNNTAMTTECKAKYAVLKQEEQILMREKGRLLTQHSLVGGEKRNSRKSSSTGNAKRDNVTNGPTIRKLDMEASGLADLARAHNVGIFDDSQSDIISSTKQADYVVNNGKEVNGLTTDIVVKKEIMNGLSANDDDNADRKRENEDSLVGADVESMPVKRRRSDS